MNEVIMKAVAGFLNNKPELRRSDLDGMPTLEVKLDVFDDAGSDEIPEHAELNKIAEKIAQECGCIFSGDRFIIIVRHPRDLRLGLAIDCEGICASIANAQNKFNNLFLPVYVGWIEELHEALGLEAVAAKKNRGDGGDLL